MITRNYKEKLNMSKSKSTKPITYTENDRVIVKTLKDAGKPLTLAEINAIANTSSGLCCSVGLTR